MANLEKLKAAGVINSKDAEALTAEQKGKLEKLTESEIQALIDGQENSSDDSKGPPATYV